MQHVKGFKWSKNAHKVLWWVGREDKCVTSYHKRCNDMTECDACDWHQSSLHFDSRIINPSSQLIVSCEYHHYCSYRDGDCLYQHSIPILEPFVYTKFDY